MLAALQQLLYGVQILGCWDWTETDMDLRRLSLWAQIKIATEVARKEQDKHGIQRLGGPGSRGRKRDMTYGQLVAETTQQEREKIVKAYWKQRGREKKKAKKKGK